MKKLTKLFTLVSLFILSLLLVVSCGETKPQNNDNNQGNTGNNNSNTNDNTNNNQGNTNNNQSNTNNNGNTGTDNNQDSNTGNNENVLLSLISGNRKYLDDSFIKRNISYKQLLEQGQFTEPVNTKILLYKDQIPFIGVNTYLNMLNETIDLGSKEIKQGTTDNGQPYTYQYYVEYSYNNNVGTITFTYKERVNGGEEQVSTDTIVFDSESDKVVFSDIELLNQIEKQEETVEGSEDQVASRIRFLSQEIQTPENEIIKRKEFNLPNFNLDLLSYNNEDIYVPVALLNQILLANSYFKVYYNGDNLLGFDYGFNKDARLDNSEYYIDREQITQELKDFDYNLLKFAFVEFYGLDKVTIDGVTYNDYEKLFKEQRFLFETDNNQDFSYGVNNIVVGLDDLHASVPKLESFYFTFGLNDETPPNKGADLISIPRTEKYNQTLEEIKRLNEVPRTSSQDLDETVYTDLEVTYTKDGKTAIITFDAFEKNTTNRLIEIFNEINTKPEVKNVVFNLMNNGGGIVGVMYETIGFITDKPFDTYVFDKLTNKKIKSSVQALTPKQNYKFFLFTSGVTFSSGNLLTQLFKENNLGKVIGQKTGGGASSIIPVLLQSGLYLNFSSKDNKTDKNYQDTEYGVSPDIEKPLADLFNLDKVQEIINSIE